MFFLVITNVERFRENEQLVNAWDRNRKLTKTSISKTLLFNAAVELDVAAFKKTDVLNNSTWPRTKKNPLLGNNYQDFQNSIKLNWASSSRFWWGGHQYQMEWSVLFCESFLYLRNWWRCYKLKVGDSYFCAQGNLFDCSDISGTSVTWYSNSSAKIYCFPPSLKFSFESQLSPNFLELHMAGWIA